MTKGTCVDIRAADLLDYCFLGGGREIRWRSVLAFLDSLGVDTISDATKWSSSGPGEDDVVIAVEVLRADRYREYTFSHFEAEETKRRHAIELLEAASILGGSALARDGIVLNRGVVWEQRLRNWLVGSTSRRRERRLHP
jgi:hypothetical protein